MNNKRIDGYNKRKYDNIMINWIKTEFHFTHMLTIATKGRYDDTAFARGITDNIFLPMKNELNYKFGALMFFGNQERHQRYLVSEKYDHVHIAINFPFPRGPRFEYDITQICNKHDVHTHITDIYGKGGLVKYLVKENLDILHGGGQIGIYRKNVLREAMREG